MTNESDRRFISSLARGLTVLSGFSAAQPRMTLSEITRHTGLPKSTVVRILFTLVDLGYMDFKSSDSTYSPGPKSMALGLSVVSSMDLVTVATPYLEKLAESTGQVVNFGIRDDLSVIYCARKGPHQLLQLNIQVGSRLNLHNTAIGRTLISFAAPDDREDLLQRLAGDPVSRTSAEEIRAGLPLTLKRGFTVTDRTLSPSVRAIAVPVWRENKLAGALNIAYLADSISMEQIVETDAAKLIDAAEKISMLLGSTPEFILSNRKT
ncbi:MAG: IclR family transcriptional regulator [Hoeflea sp. D1-CHI-28]